MNVTTTSYYCELYIRRVIINILMTLTWLKIKDNILANNFLLCSYFLFRIEVIWLSFVIYVCDLVLKLNSFLFLLFKLINQVFYLLFILLFFIGRICLKLLIISRKIVKKVIFIMKLIKVFLTNSSWIVIFIIRS